MERYGHSLGSQSIDIVQRSLSLPSSSSLSALGDFCDAKGQAWPRVAKGHACDHLSASTHAVNSQRRVAHDSQLSTMSTAHSFIAPPLVVTCNFAPALAAAATCAAAAACATVVTGFVGAAVLGLGVAACVGDSVTGTGAGVCRATTVGLPAASLAVACPSLLLAADAGASPGRGSSFHVMHMETTTSKSFDSRAMLYPRARGLPFALAARVPCTRARLCQYFYRCRRSDLHVSTGASCTTAGAAPVAGLCGTRWG